REFDVRGQKPTHHRAGTAPGWANPQSLHACCHPAPDAPPRQEMPSQFRPNRRSGCDRARRGVPPKRAVFGQGHSLKIPTVSYAHLRFGASAERASEEAFRAPQVAEASDIGKRKREPKLVLVAHVGEGKAPVLDIESAAVPVVRQLGRPILQLRDTRIQTHGDCATKPPLILVTVAEHSPVLVELHVSGRTASG